MTRIRRRRIVDFVATAITVAPFIWSRDWLALSLVVAYGMWNYYDGLTRCNLK